MYIYPAIDLFGGKAVRLYKGDYAQMTVYSDKPLEVARDFEKSGARHLHIVDLEGAKSGTTPNLETIKNILQNTSLFTEIGGGIRNIDDIRRILRAGADKVSLNSAAVKNKNLISDGATYFGSQCIVLAVDAKRRVDNLGWNVFVNGGRIDTGIDA